MPSPQLQTNRDEVARFLEILHGDMELSPGASLPVWYTKPRAGDRPDKKFPTVWRTSTSDAADAVGDIGPGHHIYFGVGLHDRAAIEREVRVRAEGENDATIAKRIIYSRGFRATVSALPGFWLDIDYGTEGHDQGNLPPDAVSAQRIITELPIQPSMVVNTGGGYHAYWLLREPWEFDTPEERAEAEAISYGWNKLARETAQRLGPWSLDSTWDLARVLRPPGTVNPKHARMVELALAREERFNPSDFDAWAMTPQQRAQARPITTSITAGLEAPAGQLAVLLELDLDFERTWERRRGGQFGDDASRYEQAIATRAMQAGWDDADIVAALVQFRRERFNEGPKHQGYYAQTLATARGDATASDALAQMEELNAQHLEDARALRDEQRASTPADPFQREVLEALEGTPRPEPAAEEPPAPPPAAEAAGPPESPPDGPGAPGGPEDGSGGETDAQRIWRLLGDTLGGSAAAVPFLVRRIARRGRETAGASIEYFVEVNGTTVELGPFDGLVTWRRFRYAVGEVCRALPLNRKQQAWERTVNTFLPHIEDASVAALGEDIQDAVLEMLRSSPAIWHDGISEPTSSRSYFDPRRGRSQVLVGLRHLKQHLHAQGERMDATALRRELSAAGALQERPEFQALDEGGRTRTVRRGFWVCPWTRGRVTIPPRPEAAGAGE